MLTGSELPSNQLVKLPTLLFALLWPGLASSSAVTAVDSSGEVLFGEADREELRNGRYVLDLDGDCESRLGRRGGISIVVRDLLCPRAVVGGGNLGIVLSSSVGHVDCTDSVCCILSMTQVKASNSFLLSFVCPGSGFGAKRQVEPDPTLTSVLPSQVRLSMPKTAQYQTFDITQQDLKYWVRTRRFSILLVSPPSTIAESTEHNMDQRYGVVSHRLRSQLEVLPLAYTHRRNALAGTSSSSDVA